jgi:hypothetical protein
MDVIITVLGVVGLAAAGFFFVDLAVDGIRRHQYLEIVAAVAAVLLTIWLLFSFGDKVLA